MAMEPRLNRTAATSTETSEDAADRIFKVADAPNKLAYEPKDFSEAWNIASLYAKRRLFGVEDPESAFVIMQTGKEMGLSTSQSFRMLYIVDNKPALYAAGAVALIRSSAAFGSWQEMESTAEKCTIRASRKGEEPRDFTFTFADASKIFMDKERKKPLVGKDVWQNYPKRMLRHRCESEVANALFQDVTFGLPLGEEVEREREDSPPTRPTSTSTVDIAPRKGKPATPAPEAAVPPSAPAPAAIAPADAWRAKLDAVTTRDELAKLVAEVPVELRAPLKSSFDAAKTRVAPKKVEPAVADTKPTEPASVPATIPGTAAPEEILGMWSAALAKLPTAPEVMDTIVGHVDELPSELREQALAIGATRLAAVGGVNFPAAAIKEALSTAKKAA